MSADEAVAAETAGDARATARRYRRRRLAAAKPRGSDDALDLGATVLPILVKSYWKPVLAVLVVIGIIIWLHRQVTGWASGSGVRTPLTSGGSDGSRRSADQGDDAAARDQLPM